MVKDNVRDYAIDAFRFYAINGPSEVYKKRMPADLQAEDVHLKKIYSELKDIEAVERTLVILSKELNGSDIVGCIEAVYFKDANRVLRKGAIQSRVDQYSTVSYITGRQLYRYLANARRTFAVERGLRL